MHRKNSFDILERLTKLKISSVLFSYYSLHIYNLCNNSPNINVLKCFDWINPSIKTSYKILQRLSPKHVARGVVQSLYPIYSQGKPCLSEQLQWRAAADPRLARGKSWVRAPAPAGALRALFFSTLPSFLLCEIVFFRTFPTHSIKVLGKIFTVNCNS